MISYDICSPSEYGSLSVCFLIIIKSKHTTTIPIGIKQPKSSFKLLRLMLLLFESQIVKLFNFKPYDFIIEIKLGKG